MLRGLGGSATTLGVCVLLSLVNPALAQRDSSLKGAPRLQGAAAPEHSWTYGRHPVLGVSAYVQTPTGGFAIGCNSSSEHGGALFFRIEDSLDPAPGRRDKLVIIEGSHGPVLLDGQGTHVLKDPVKFPYFGVGYDDFVSTKSGYIQKYQNAVDAPLEQLRYGKAVYLARGSVDDNTDDAIIVNQGGQSIVLRSNADLSKLNPMNTISLNNSNVAIRQLMENCPRIADPLDYDPD